MELGVVHLVPACTRHRALTVPADAAATPESRRRCRLDVGTLLADRERSCRSLGLGPGTEALEPPPPKSLAKGSDLGLASGGASTSFGSSSRRSNGAEGTIPLKASSPPPVVFTDTIRIPGASAAAPEFLPSTRPLADFVTIYHYIYRLVLLTSQPERVFRQSHSTSQDSCGWYLPPVYLNPLARLSVLSQELDSCS